MALIVSAEVITRMNAAIAVGWSRTIVAEWDYRAAQNTSGAVRKIIFILAAMAVRFVTAGIAAIHHAAAASTDYI